jgi:acetyltransferase
MSEKSLEKFFNPKSVAVIGASSDKGKIGYEILKNILDASFKGKVYPVNLKSKKILGLSVYASVLSVTGDIDLAIVVIPANFVNPVLIECGEKGIKNVIVISSGFKEIGREGVVLEKEMKEISAKFDMQILGPNCLGIADSSNKLNASFARGMIKKGSLAFVSQSGAIVSAILDWANLNEIGFSKFVSLGNKAVVSEVEVLNYLKNDNSVSAIFAYLEDIKDGKEFMKVASEVVLKKPLIVIKPGTSESSQKAMQSHTGALSGNEKGIELAFAGSGVVRVQNMQQLFNLVNFFSRYQGLSGNRIAVLTNAGGPGVIATDELERNGLKLAKLGSETKKTLALSLPKGANINNPVDVLGDAKEDRYKAALEILAKDKNIDCILVVLTPQAGTEIEKTAKVISDFAKNNKKPIAVNFAGGEMIAKSFSMLSRSGVANYGDFSEAIYALGKAYEYEKNKKNAVEYLKGLNSKSIKKAEAENIKNLSFIDSLHLINKYGIDIVPTSVAFSPEEAVVVAERVGYPLVMKIFSDTITHKTEVAGVKVGIKDRLEVKEYFEKIKKILGNDLKGMAIQPMIKGQEIILGVKKDKNFGHMIMFGLGGIYAEIMKDVSFRLAPLNHEEALRMIGEIKSFKILNGYRSLPKVDIEKIADALVGISNLVSDYPKIEELDINPIIADENGYKAVDVRIVFGK